MANYPYGELRKGYAELWARMEIPAGRRLAATDARVRAIADGKARYDQVANATGVPWYVIGIIHEMEGGLTRPNTILAARELDFTSPLLYDGVQLKMDGLKDTYLVESGRMEKWNGTTFEKVTDLYSYEGETRPTFE